MEPCGFLLVQHREQYMQHFLHAELNLGDDFTASGIPFYTCIRRLDGIHISTEYQGIKYELHFDETGAKTDR